MTRLAGVEEFGDAARRAPMPSRRDRAARTGLGSRHQPRTGVTTKLLGGSHERRQLAEDVDARADPGPVSSSASRKRRGDLVGVLEVLRSAGKGDLSGVRAHVVRALDQQHLWTVGPVAEQDQHRRRPRRTVRRWRELRPPLRTPTRTTSTHGFEPAGQLRGRRTSALMTRAAQSSSMPEVLS